MTCYSFTLRHMPHPSVLKVKGLSSLILSVNFKRIKDEQTNLFLCHLLTEVWNNNRTWLKRWSSKWQRPPCFSTPNDAQRTGHQSRALWTRLRTLGMRMLGTHHGARNTEYGAGAGPYSHGAVTFKFILRERTIHWFSTRFIANLLPSIS